MTSAIPVHPSGETMKAVCFKGYGEGTEGLSVETIPKPFVSTPDEVLIKVYAAALNPIDKSRFHGSLSLLFPEEYDTSVLGYDVSGVVEEVGDEAAKLFKAGDEVYVRLEGMKYGALAEYVVCSPPEIGKKPSNLTHVQAAAVPLAGLTALQALRRGGVTEGSKVFIPAGAGGVGSLAIQIAKKMLKAGHVATTASPGKGTDICKWAGADQIIDYRSQSFETVLAGEGFDMAFDTTNESTKMGPILKEGSKVVCIAGAPTSEGVTASLGPQSLVTRILLFAIRNRTAERAIQSVGASWEYIFMKPSGKDLNELTPFLESGEIEPVIDTEASSLEDFMVAVEKLFSGRAKGKCVVKVA